MKIPNHTIASRVPEKKDGGDTQSLSGTEEKSSLYLDQIL